MGASCQTFSATTAILTDQLSCLNPDAPHNPDVDISQKKLKVSHNPKLITYSKVQRRRDRNITSLHTLTIPDDDGQTPKSLDPTKSCQPNPEYSKKEIKKSPKKDGESEGDWGDCQSLDNSSVWDVNEGFLGSAHGEAAVKLSVIKSNC
jgi:hypothetical protein